jgi:CheY-like chemotaxis protein
MLKSTRHILLVHDQNEAPYVRQSFLEGAGFRVSAVGSSEAALQHIQDARPDAVVMDILIEGLNGFETCRRIRRLHDHQDLPVVLCSEIYRSRAFRDEAFSAGAQRYLLKPLRLEELVGELQALLASRQDAAA